MISTFTDNSKNFRAPKGFRLGDLSKEHSIKINAVWPHRSEGSEKFIEYLIENNAHVGLFDKATGELVAWCFQHDFGSLAILQVDENYFRKGYGEVVTRAITRKIAAEFNVDITSNIIVNNEKSLNLFTKLGFIDVENTYWIGVQC